MDFHMKNFLVVFILIFVVNVKLFSQTESDSTLSLSLKKWSESFNLKDTEQALSFISEDYIGYFPDQPDQFYETLKELYQKILSNKNLNVSIKYFINDYSISGDLAVVRLTITTTAKPSFAQQAQVAREKGIQVWRKENQSWKLFRSVTFPISK